MSSIKELRKKLLQQTKKQVSTEYSEKELSIIRASNALEDLDSSSNIIFEHTREWHHAFFPELEGIVKEPEKILQLIYEIGSKKNFSEKKIATIISNPEQQNQLIKAAKESIGSNEDEKTIKEIQLMALNSLNLKEERKMLELFVENEMSAVAPNFSKIAGSILAARLLSKAGTIKKLAEMPASTIQLLGAEKALFRHLKTRRKARTPKYGFLYSHSLVKQLSPGHKGAMARTLAGKLSIAVKADAFGKKDIHEELEKQLKERFESLQKRPVKQKKTRQDFFEQHQTRQFQKRKPFSGSQQTTKKFHKRKPFFRKKTGKKKY